MQILYWNLIIWEIELMETIQDVRKFKVMFSCDDTSVIFDTGGVRIYSSRSTIHLPEGEAVITPMYL
ncbi:hypothetical protein GWI33_008224 [Rhynchophorus ferrugineus]|uniref:Uncharacterized protein n=1 Tax=Rhynchophorus ferrugineus TaxID=354439 RepID=A0A834MG11_RHYFE|nr:hypothetical protein GWI33_008224 [Rhynchophorus ferrugineus]